MLEILRWFSFNDAYYGPGIWTVEGVRSTLILPETPMELPIFQLLPSSAQLIFTGDKMPLQCAASLVGGGTSLTWRHNGRTVGRQAEALGILLEPMKVHDCSVVTR